MSRPLQAIVFDFDGVIANSEPLHLLAFQQALAEDGIELSATDYYSRYLGYDDVGMFEALGRDRGMSMQSARVAELVARKGDRMQDLMRSGSVLFPGATRVHPRGGGGSAHRDRIRCAAPRDRRDHRRGRCG